jgi:DNA invertase Pin-like site-specific DNA recombinase
MSTALASLPEDLTPEPATRTGALIGYARVATGGQLLDRQVAALREAGCSRVFTDNRSGRHVGRPELEACLGTLRPGDTLVIARLDGLGRSLQDLIGTVVDLRRRGAGFRSLHEALDTTTPGGRLVFHVFAALAEFIRELIVEGTHDGLNAARARGVRLGRPQAMNAEQIRHARDLLTRPENTVSSIARLLGVSRSTIYKYVPEIGAVSHVTPAGLPTSPPARHQSRPGRRVLVAASLADLRGPTQGTVELPLRLFWSSPDRTFNLDDPDARQWLYQTVLREATRPEDLTAYLDGDTLISIWADMYLPKGVRQAWEERHPVLRASVTAA